MNSTEELMTSLVKTGKSAKTDFWGFHTRKNRLGESPGFLAILYNNLPLFQSPTNEVFGKAFLLAMKTPQPARTSSLPRFLGLSPNFNRGHSKWDISGYTKGLLLNQNSTIKIQSSDRWNIRFLDLDRFRIIRNVT